MVYLKPKEKDIQRQIITWMRLKGYACGKTKTLGSPLLSTGGYRKDRLTFRGFPDLTAFVPELVFIEVKGPGGRLRSDQRDFQELCKRADVRYIVAYSLDDVRGLLDPIPIRQEVSDVNRKRNSAKD